MAKWGGAIASQYVRSSAPRGPKPAEESDYVEERRTARQYNFLEPAGGELTRSFLEDNRLAAAKLKTQLDMAGVTGGDHYDEVTQAARTGAQKGLGFLGNALEFIDKPLRTVKAAVLDLSQLDKIIGDREIDFSEAAAGIWKDDDERLRRAVPKGLLGEDLDFSTDAILTSAGWRTEDANWFNKAIRFGVHGVTDIGLDPISWATGGLAGVSKKAAGTGLSGLVAKFGDDAVRAARSGADDLTDAGAKVVKEAIEARRGKIDDLIKKNIDSGMDADDAADAAWDAVRQEAEFESLIEPLKAITNRDFASMPDWVRNSKAIQKEMPWIQGGLRLSTPLGGGLRSGLGAPIPGTVGLGRKLTRGIFRPRGGEIREGIRGTLLEALPKNGGLTSKTARMFLSKFDANAPIIASWRKGTFEGVQNAQFMMDSVNQARTELGLRDIERITGRASQNVLDHTLKLNKAEVGQVNDALRAAMRSGNYDELMTALPETLSPEARRALHEYAETYRTTMDNIHTVYADLVPSAGAQQDYMPLVFKDGFSDFVRAVGRTSDQGVPIFDDAPEELQEGLSMLSQMVAASQRTGQNGTAVVGDPKYLRTRTMGLEVDPAELQDFTGVQLLRGRERLGVGFQTHEEINEKLMAAAEWVAKREKIKLKDGSLFSRKNLESALEMDPLLMMNRYLDSMMAGLQERYIVKRMLDIGMLKPADFRAEVHRSIAQTFDNLYDEKTQKSIDDLTRAIVDTIDGEEGRVAEAFAETKEVYLGGSMGTIELPASAVKEPSPLLRRRIEEAKTRSRAWETAKVTRERRATELKERLVAEGVDDGVAAALAAAGSASDMRGILRQAIRDADDAAREAAHRVDEIGVRFGSASDEALKAQRAARREAAHVRRTAEQIAAKSRNKLNKELDREVKRLTKGRTFRATFDSEADRKALVDRAIPHVVDDLATRGAPEEFTEAIEAQLRRLAAGDPPEEIATEIAALKQTIIDGLPDVVPTNRLEGLAELARSAGRALRDAGVVDDDAVRYMDEAGLTGSGNVFEIVAGYRDRLGGAFRSARNLPERMRKAQMDRLQKAYRLLDDTEEAFRAAVSAPEADAGLRDWLQSNDLLIQMELVAKLARGEDVFQAPRAVVGQLKKMLDDLGVTGQGRRLHRSKSSRVGFEVLGEPEEWATVSELRAEAKRLGGGDDITSLRPEIVEQLSEKGRRTWAALDNLPAHMRALQNLETTIREGARYAELAAHPGKISADKVARAAQRSQRTWLDFEEQVLRPFRKKTATVTELTAADSAFRAQYPALRKVLAPSEVSQLDMFGEELARRRALREAGTTDAYREAVDSINLYKETMFDEETTAESLRQLAEQVARRKAEATTQEAMRSYQMLDEMGTLFKNLLGLAQDADGNVIRRVLSDTERETLDKYIDKGRRLWANIDDLPNSQSPFEKVVTVTAERPGFVPPSVDNMGGQAWDGMVGDRYAMEWMGNMSAQVASMYNSEVLTATVRNFRQVMSWWKAQATIVRPTFHIRNAIGAVWNGMLGDVRMSNYKAAIAHGPSFIHNLRRMDFEDALGLVPEQYRQAVRWADNVGVFDDMFATTELIDRQLKRRSKQRFNPLSQSGPTARAGGRVMMDIEGTVRLAVFFRHFDSAATNPQAAARHAKAWVDAIHFNYNELTEGERWARTFVPFFVWTRRNLPLQLRTLIERPQYLRRYQHLINAADSFNDDEADDLPGSMYRAKGISSVLGEINDDTDFFSRVIFDPDLPINVLFELDQPYSPETWLNLLFNQLGPQFDLLASFQNMDDNSYYTTAPGGIGQLMNVLPPPGADRTSRGVARVAPWASGLYRTALPALNELGGFLGEADPRRRQALGQAPDPEAEGVDTIKDEFKALGFTLLRGLGVHLEGVDDSYSNAAVTSIRLSEIARELKDRGVITPEIAETVDEMSDEELEAIVASLSETQVGS